MPEASVYKDCDFRRSEYDVGSTSETGLGSTVKAVTETSPVKRLADAHFTLRVLSLLLHHA